MNPKLIKTKTLEESEKYYWWPIKTLLDEDKKIIDEAKTDHSPWNTSQSMVDFPSIHRGEYFKLPYNEYSIVKYENTSLRVQYPRSSGWGQYHWPHYNQDNNYSGEIFGIMCYGNPLWQHFIQDSLPMLWFARELLQAKPQIKVLMTYDKKEHIDFVWDKFELKNEILYMPDVIPDFNHFPAKNTYIFESNFEVPLHWWNNFFFKEINFLFNKNIPYEQKNIIYCKRNINRKIFNEQELIEMLQKKSTELNKNFIVFEAEKVDFLTNVDIFRNAYAIVAPHGGANYNIIFSHPGTKFFEFTFTDCMYTLYNIASGIGLDYYMIPYPGNNNTPGIIVKKEHIDKLYELI